MNKKTSTQLLLLPVPYSKAYSLNSLLSIKKDFINDFLINDLCVEGWFGNRLNSPPDG